MMRLCGVLFAAMAVLPLAADEKKDDAAKEELKKLEGTWELVTAERDAVRMPADGPKGMKAVVKGNILTFAKGDEVFAESTIAIDPTKKPKTIDATSTKNDDKGKIVIGIYELEGDNLKLCLARGKERPTEFSTKKDSGCTLYVYKRAK
jgi:uncharacterized protein (TIGR03067 family)